MEEFKQRIMKILKRIVLNSGINNCIYSKKTATKILFYLATIITSVSIVSILLISAFNTMVADDSYYFQWISRSGAKNFLSEHYNYLNGRFGQFSIVAILFKIFGEASVKIAPVILSFSLIGATSFLAYTIIPFKKNKKVLSLFTGSLLTVAYIFSLSSLVDSLLWLTSSTVYLTSVIFIVLNAALILNFFKRKSFSKTWLFISSATIIIGQGFSELSSLFVIGWLVLATLYLAYLKDYRWKYSLVFLASSIGGFMINYFSPGTRSRLGILKPNPLGWGGTATQSFHPYSMMFSSMSYWWLLIILFLAILIVLNVDIKKISKKSFAFKNLTLSLLIFISSTYAVFFASTYSMGNFFPYRNLTLPNFGVVVSVAIILVWSVIYIREYLVTKFKVVSYLVLSTIVVMLVVLYAFDNIKILSVRHSAFLSRKRSIERQLSQNKDLIYIQAVPVTYIHSNAVEIEDLPLDKQVDWMVKGIRLYYKIPDDKKVNIIKTSQDYCVYSLNVKNNYRCQ